MNLTDNQIGRFNRICRIRDLEFLESHGGRDLDEERETFASSRHSLDKPFLKEQFNEEELKYYKKILEVFKELDICHEEGSLYENLITKESWDEIRKVFKDFLSLPSIQETLKEMEQYEEYSVEGRKKEFLEIQKRLGIKTDKGLQYWIK